MRHVCVVGLNWGDEGKGKIVDVLAKDVAAVVRYQGGANAGHTVYIGDVKHVLHHLPMGVLHGGILAILGNGMVIEPKKLLEEFLRQYRNLNTAVGIPRYLQVRMYFFKDVFLLCPKCRQIYVLNLYFKFSTRFAQIFSERDPE